jgi:hypothetical protein
MPVSEGAGTGAMQKGYKGSCEGSRNGQLEPLLSKYTQ